MTGSDVINFHGNLCKKKLQFSLQPAVVKQFGFPNSVEIIIKEIGFHCIPYMQIICCIQTCCGVFCSERNQSYMSTLLQSLHTPHILHPLTNSHVIWLFDVCLITTGLDSRDFLIGEVGRIILHTTKPRGHRRVTESIQASCQTIQFTQENYFIIIYR